MLLLKKLISAAVCVCIFCSFFASCSKASGKTAVNISGLELSDEIFIYYLDKVSSNPEDYSLNETSVQDDYIKITEQLCAEYAAFNTEFDSLGLTLDTEHKTEISEDVSDEWRVYSDYYKSIGVSKQTLTKIHTGSAKSDVIFSSYYDEGGSKEVPVDEIKEYFYANYVAFSTVNGYLTATDEKGNTVALDNEGKKALRAKFNSLLTQIDNGATLEEVGTAYAKEQDSTSTSGTVNVLKRGSSEYPEGFYDKVAALSGGKAAVVEVGDYIFLVIRTDMSKDDETYFSAYRSACLKSLKSDEFDSSISEIAGSYIITENENQLDKLIENYKSTQRESS